MALYLSLSDAFGLNFYIQLSVLFIIGTSRATIEISSILLLNMTIHTNEYIILLFNFIPIVPYVLFSSHSYYLNIINGTHIQFSHFCKNWKCFNTTDAVMI